MKVGDNLICRKNCCLYDVSNNCNGVTTTCGNVYKVRNIYRGIVEIINDNGYLQGFYIDNEQTSDNNYVTSAGLDQYYYGNWFYTAMELRKLKLEKLKHL